MEENKIIDDEERLALKQVRKERKLLKKALKREERERENDRRKLELKLGPTDQHITIISKNIADNINNPKETSVCNNNKDFNLSINDSFPNLGVAVKSKQKHVKTNSALPTNKQNLSTKHTRTSTLTINLTEILTKPKQVVTQKPIIKEVEKYGGNILDSSQPKRHKGKHRENPKPKLPTKLKSQIIADINECGRAKSFNNFCDNTITDELNTIVEEFLSSIVKYQENLYKTDSIKGTARRRYVTGFREIKKYLLVNKIKFLIVAPNIQCVKRDGALNTLLHELISLASENNIPYVFALSRRKLGHITLKHIPISCVGIFYYDGAEQLCSDIMKLLETLRKPTENNKKQECETINRIITGLNSNTINQNNY